MSGIFTLGTWRALGLVSGTMFVGLGSAVLVQPYTMSQSLTIKPLVNNPSDPTIRMARLLGARDVSLGAAICSLWYYGQDKAVGLVILSSMFLCGADIVEVFNSGESGLGVLFSALTGTVGLTGWALFNEG